ncbi:MAG: PEP-CTERM sorting domain-containing protein [Acidihalobacter sp.]
MKIKNLAIAAMLCIGIFGWSAANATLIDTVYLNQSSLGAQPNAPEAGAANGSWLVASLEQDGTDASKYTLTLNSHLTHSNFVRGKSGIVSSQVGWALNIAGTISGGYCSGGVCASQALFTSRHGYGVPRLGSFNLGFAWNHGFGGVDSATYILTASDPLSLITNEAGFASAAHIQNISSDNSNFNNLFLSHNCCFGCCCPRPPPCDGDGWITAAEVTPPPTHNVPEPSELPMMFLGLALLGGLGLYQRRSRKS